ncbi:MAG TPA: dihydrofolate reductase [Pirellulaceae bacterium]
MNAEPSPRISLIVAVADNGVIGHQGRIPWRIRGDLRRFKELTWGHPLVMGRATFESLGRVLPGRRHVVLSRDPAFGPGGVLVARSWSEALEHVANVAEVFVIGGADVYRLALPHAHRIYLTEVHATPAGDTLFPRELFQEWGDVVDESRSPASEADEFATTFRVLERPGERKPAPHVSSIHPG